MTEQGNQDSGTINSEMAMSSTDHRIYVEIPTKSIQDMKLRYFSLNDIFDNDADIPPHSSPSIDLKSGNDDRQAPCAMNDKADGDLETHNFATELGRQ